MENKHERKRSPDAFSGEEPEECIILKKGEILKDGISLKNRKKTKPGNKGSRKKTCTHKIRGGDGDEDI